VAARLAVELESKGHYPTLVVVDFDAPAIPRDISNNISVVTTSFKASAAHRDIFGKTHPLADLNRNFHRCHRFNRSQNYLD